MQILSPIIAGLQALEFDAIVVCCENKATSGEMLLVQMAQNSFQIEHDYL